MTEPQRVAVFNADGPVSNEIKSRNTLYNVIWTLVFVAGLGSLGLLTYLLARFAYEIGATHEETAVVFVFALIIAALTAGIPVARTYARRRIPGIEGFDNAAWIICFIVSTAAAASFLYSQHTGGAAKTSAPAAAIQQTACWYSISCLDARIQKISDETFHGPAKAPGVEEKAQRDINIIDARIYWLKKHPEQAPEPAKTKPQKTDGTEWTTREIVSLVFAIFAAGSMIFLTAFALWFGVESLIAFSSEGNLSALTPIIPTPPLGNGAPVDPRDDPIRDAYNKWVRECLEWSRGDSLWAEKAYRHYKTWCTWRNLPSLGSSNALGAELQRENGPFARNKVMETKSSGKMRYLGVKLVDDEITAELDRAEANGD